MKTRVLLIFLFLFTSVSYAFAASPPSLTITSPEEGSFVNQTVIIEAELTTIPRVRSIKFYIDNELVGEDTESPYRYSWDTTTYPDGPHEIYASRLQAPERPPKAPKHPLDSPRINVTVDNTPPEGTISINNDDASTGSTEVILTLSATDSLSGMDKMQFSNNGTYWSDPEDYDTQRSWILTTGDGTKTVYARFKDVIGNWSDPVSDTIVLDTTPPVVEITSPLDGEIFSSTPISVSGTVSDNIDDNPNVTVNEVEATVSLGQFSVDNVSLALGDTTITAIATDEAGNTSTDSVTVTYDNTPPTIPTVTDDGTYTNSLIELHASWSSEDSETGIAEYQYSIGTTAGSTDVLDWTVVGTDTGVIHTGLALTQGQTYYFNVKAQNQAGLWSEVGSSDGIVANDSSTLLIDITFPENSALYNTSPITIEGTVSIDSATVIVNGTSATVVDNTFTASVTINEGNNIIIAKAISGNQAAQDRIDVRLDSTPPSITVFTPDENATTRSNIIHGRVSDDSSSVTVNSTSVELMDNYFIAQPFLTEGLNTITIEAQDQAGNTVQVAHTFIYDTTTPKVTITSPTNNSTIDLSPITVRGTTSSDITYIVVETSIAIIEETNFTATHIRLNPIKSAITATGYDEDDNKYQDTIVINTPDLKHYELIKISGDIQEYEEDIPEAGSNWDLTLKLYCNDVLATDEEIEFTVTEGNGTIAPQSALTDYNAEAATTLTTDTNTSITNKIEAELASYPEVTTTFYVDTKSGLPAVLSKLTDESITPVPGATIELIVKLTDQYNNPISDEEITYQIISGPGLISPTSNITNEYGYAKVILTTTTSPSTPYAIQVQSTSNPSLTVTFNITTSGTITLTVDDVMAKVAANDQLIQDLIADITVTSDAPWTSPIVQLRIWQKVDKQKVEELSPNPAIYIRPELQGAMPELEQTILFFDPVTDEYVIKSKLADQVTERPYELLYVDFSKGVITKVELFQEVGDKEIIQSIEYLEFIQLPEANNAWIYNKKIERFWENNQLQYTTTKVISNRVVNTGIADSEFEP